MRPVLIVLIFIIVLIALIMAYLLIVSNTRSEKGGPTVFDMMMRNKDVPGEESGESGNAPRISKESEPEPPPLEGRENPPSASQESRDAPSSSEGSEDSSSTWEKNRVDAAKQKEDAP